MLILDRLEAQRCLRVSRKPSLLAAAAAGGGGGGALPKAFGEVSEGALLSGYVANVTGDAVYVRFLAGLTGGWVGWVASGVAASLRCICCCLPC